MTDRSAEFGFVLDVTVEFCVLFPAFGSAALAPVDESTPLLMMVPAAVAVAVKTGAGTLPPEVSGAPLVTVRLQVMVAGPATGAAGEQLHPFSV